jgi:nucleotide-binding universal stress UspA family protein
MLRVERILCPTDFSEPSYRALHTAVELAQIFSSRLTIVHVVRATPFKDVERVAAQDAHFSAAVESMMASAEEALRRLARDKVAEGIQRETVVREGHAGVEIVKQASEEKADLIVIAGHGGSDRTHSIFGSVANHVVQIAPCPVWVIPFQPEP